MEFKGYTYGYTAKHGDYRSKEGILSQELLFETGINWMCLAVALTQETAHSLTIDFDFENSSSDRDIMAAVERAHKNNIKVCLKPMVNCRDGVWRALINFADSDFEGNDIYWDKWFESYGSFMKYYAELAEETGCEMLCIGCELCSTERKETHWRKLIAGIRTVYSGKLIYNTNHGKEEEVKWFDAVDYVGTSAYYPVSRNGDSPEAMKKEWRSVRDRMYRVYQKWNKKIVFMEIGCRSAHGCAAMPWDFVHTELPHDEEEQANFFDSCLSVFAGEEWFGGMFWWDWSTTVYTDRETAKSDNGFNIHLKKAEDVLKKWYERLE